MDPVALEVIKHGLLSIAEEEAAVLRRTAHSLNIRERTDYSTAVCDTRGHLVVQAMRTPIHLGGIAPCIKAIVSEYSSDIAPDDIFISNDPYSGGQHPPDIQISLPVFWEDELIGFTCALAHHLDIGGRVPSGISAQSREVLEEGLRLSHVKLFEAGKPGRQVFKIIEKNVRFPEITLGDLNAEIAAVRTGSKRLTEMIEKFGVEVVLEAFVLLMEISERRTRESLARIPSGSYEFEDYIDSDGLTPDPRKIAVKIAIGDGNITIDFTGTDEQGLGSINSSLTATQSAVYYAVRCLTDPDIMQNEGCTRPIIVVAPEGTLVNPCPPAACAGRSNIAHRIVDVVFGALSDVIPEKVETASYGTSPCYSIFGSVGGTRRLYMDCNHGSSGARLGLDGNDGCTSKTSNPQNLTIEATEAYLPIRFARYEFVMDSGGPGEARGGMAIDRAVKILFDNAQVEVRADRQAFPPYGLQGGAAGKETKVTVVRKSGQAESLPSCSRASLEFGDEFSLVCASAGGFGDPKRRPVELVVRDVEDGKVSIQGAAHDYGVVLRPDLSVDWEATNGLRLGVEEGLR